MITRMRKTLAVVGGVNGALAVIAIAWGLQTLARIADEKAAQLEMLDQEIAARVDQLDPPDTDTITEDPKPRLDPVENEINIVRAAE